MPDDTAVRTEAGQKLLKWLKWVARDEPRDAREYALMIAAVERAAEAWGKLRAMEALAAHAQPAPDLLAAAQAVVDAWDHGHGEPKGSTYLALPTQAEMDALRAALATEEQP